MKKAVLIGLGITALVGIAAAVISSGACCGTICEPGCCFLC